VHPEPIPCASDAPAAGEPGASGGTRAAAAAMLRVAAEGGAVVAGPHLVVVAGSSAGERIALRHVQTLGRGAGADVRVADPCASRVHARVRLDGAVATVEDLRSKNGVRVNGARVRRGRRRLAPGDEIALGATVLAFEDASPAAAPPAVPAARPPRTALAFALRWVAAALLAACAAALGSTAL
jgi:S-DNA-T family DNA segregation ATPase FtsK/SpoIIIE